MCKLRFSPEPWHQERLRMEKLYKELIEIMSGAGLPSHHLSLVEQLYKEGRKHEEKVKALSAELFIVKSNAKAFEDQFYELRKRFKNGPY